MTELQFWADLKKNSIKFFWGMLFIQLILGVAWMIWTGSDVRTTGTRNSKEIDQIKLELSQKATIQMVLQIKTDQSLRMNEILVNTKELKEGQLKLMELFFNHLNTGK